MTCARALALFALPLCACAAALPALPRSAELAIPAGRFELEFDSADVPSERAIRAAIVAAQPRLAPWGALREPVTIQILPTHALLEAAVDRPGYPWLRAWARYDVVFVQSPRTWRWPFGGTQVEINDLLLHELTHCLMYQQAADRTGWSRKEIPLWFRES